MKIVKKVGEQILPHWLRAELRPVLVFTGAGTALWAGSCELVERAWKAAADYSTRDRLFALGIAGYLAAYGCWHAPQIARFAIPGAVVAWCVAAWWVTPIAPRPGPAEQLVDTAPELTLAELVAIVRRVAAHRQGAHLADLLAEPELDGWTQAELKATVTGHFGLPVEEFKLILGSRQRVRDGVRVRDLPPAPALADPVGAPQDPAAGPAPQPLPPASQGPG
ncbi:hypothetical protein [Streptomyces sp. STR69]|uniref:hypothetical protein n=1 Tax=Streptomyces sp. STR69 TaxID=1796942 RepID=UPI0021C70915|nr:hypothetical protein [Streptomyces sp. STR69]